MTKGEFGNIQAYFTLELDGIWISGFKLIETSGELWVGCPSQKKADDTYKEIVVMTKDKKEYLTKLAKDVYADLPLVVPYKESHLDK